MARDWENETEINIKWPCYMYWCFVFLFMAIIVAADDTITLGYDLSGTRTIVPPRTTNLSWGFSNWMKQINGITWESSMLESHKKPMFGFPTRKPPSVLLWLWNSGKTVGWLVVVDVDNAFTCHVSIWLVDDQIRHLHVMFLFDKGKGFFKPDLRERRPLA